MTVWWIRIRLTLKVGFSENFSVGSFRKDYLHLIFRENSLKYRLRPLSLTLLFVRVNPKPFSKTLISVSIKRLKLNTAKTKHCFRTEISFQISINTFRWLRWTTWRLCLLTFIPLSCCHGFYSLFLQYFKKITWWFKMSL